MDNQEKLAGFIKEKTQGLEDKVDELTGKMVSLEESKAKAEEDNAKILESNTELKATLDALQDKKFKASEKLGGASVVFKGYNPDLNKNFKGDLTYADAEQVAKVYLAMAHGKAIDFASEMPEGFGDTILGLSELTSRGLGYMNVKTLNVPVFTAPVKAVRETADSQASATANTSTSITSENIVWTIDKRIGSYAEVRIDQLEDALFDIVNGWVIPMQAEGIGQYLDAEVFNRTNTEFTTAIVDASASVSVATASGIAAAITYENLNTMFYALEWERGLGEPKWFGSRAALKDISGLVDDNSRPIFQQVPINGRPSQTLMGAEYVITPVVSNTPANGAIRLAFGDPAHYTICVRGGMEHLVNPYIKMKEDVVQFIAKLRADGNIDDNTTASSSGAWTTMKRAD